VGSGPRRCATAQKEAGQAAPPPTARAPTLSPLSRCSRLLHAIHARPARPSRDPLGPVGLARRRCALEAVEKFDTAAKYSNLCAAPTRYDVRSSLSCVNDPHRPLCHSFTPRRSLVRSQYRPPSSAAGSDHGTGLDWSCDSSKRHASQSPSLRRASGASDGASKVCVLTARRTS
jgi:hypothetical protein